MQALDGTGEAKMLVVASHSERDAMTYLYYVLVFVGAALITYGILDDSSSLLLPGMVVMAVAFFVRDYRDRKSRGEAIGTMTYVYYALLVLSGVLVGAGFAAESVVLLVPGVISFVAALVVGLHHRTRYRAV